MGKGCARSALEGGRIIVALERIRSGDVEALGLLLEESWEPLVLHLATILGSTEAAKDAAQEAFIRVWEHRDRWHAGSARALLFRIGRNAALDARRRREVRRRWVRERSSEAAGAMVTPQEELEASEFEARLRSALDSLPQRRREVFDLVRLQGLSYREAAEVLELSDQTVANQMSLALKDLRDQLRDDLARPTGDRAAHRGCDHEARSRDG